MSEVAFVVVAHKNPRQLRRLLTRLPADRTFLHLDSALKGENYARLLAASTEVSHVRRHRSAWASWGIAQGILEGLAAAAEATSASHVAVLSGQDYPLVPPAYMDSLLPPGRSFVQVGPLPLPWWGKRGGLDRLTDANWAVRGRRLRMPSARRMPGGLRPYGGSCWSIYARAHVEALVEHGRRHGDWWRRVWIPDEHFFASVLGSLHEPELLQQNPGYTEWMPPSPHPRTFVEDDVPRLAALADQWTDAPLGRKWFARKFDDEDGTVLPLLQERLQDVALLGTPLTMGWALAPRGDHGQGAAGH